MSPFSICGRALIFIYCMVPLPAQAFPSDVAVKEQTAITVAKHWLSLIDEGSYAASWDEAAENLRTSETRDSWVRLLHLDRSPAGAVTSRILKRCEYRIGPRGRENVDIYFETSFVNMKSVVESVGTRLEPDGQWRVTGYVIDSAKAGITSYLMSLLLAAIVVGVWVMEVKPEPRTVSEERGNSISRQDGPTE